MKYVFIYLSLSMLVLIFFAAVKTKNEGRAAQKFEEVTEMVLLSVFFPFYFIYFIVENITIMRMK